MISLAKLGHQVFLLNNTKAVTQCRGVQCIPLTLDSEKLAEIFKAIGADAVVVLSTAETGPQLRALLPKSTQLYLWSGHAANQPHYDTLNVEETKAAWDGFIFMGSWQRDTVCEKFELDRDKAVNLGMAIAPAFETQFSPDESIVSHKSAKPVLVYTSTPFRGLEVLVDAFPAIREQLPEAELRIFSSMKLYQIDEKDDQFTQLYERCRGMPGVDYVGPIPQPKLAEELKSAWVHAYANTFAETACVAIMEGMASGCGVVTSHLGSLPETCAGYAKLIAEPPTSPAYRDAFVAAVVSLCRGIEQAETNQIEEHLRAQVDYCHTHYRWDVRATQWIDWLGSR
jgi:glycosyltransferase involved in cell wall biosynthesis